MPPSRPIDDDPGGELHPDQRQPDGIVSTYPLAGVLAAALVLSCADGDGAGRVAVVERTCSVTSSCADEAIEEADQGKHRDRRAPSSDATAVGANEN